jgi:hypothetical protein
MNSTRALLSLLVVLLLSLVISFGLLYVLSGKSSLGLGNDRRIDLSSSSSIRLWGLLLGLSAGGFPVGPFLAPENKYVRALFASFGGDWFLLITATLVLVGLVGGLLAKHPLRGALASALASLILSLFGIVLTATELPHLVQDLNLPSGELSQLLSAVEVSQLAGGGFAALITGLMAALGGRVLQYGEKVPIDAVRPIKVPPIEPNVIEKAGEGSGSVTVVQPSPNPPMGVESTGEGPSPRQGIGDTGPPPLAGGSMAPTGIEEKGPLERPPPCPRCGKPLSWIPKADRYYCTTCAEYS